MENSKRVNVDIEQCEWIGNILKNLKFRPSFYQREFIAFQADKETKMRAYLYSVAICHQTYNLANKKRNLFGWDFLEFAYTNLAKNNSELLDPVYLSSLSTDELSEKLKPIFSDDGNPENCTLDRLEERARFLIDIGKIVKEKYNNKVENLIESCEGFLINGGKGLYELLEEFEAYTDPLRKKSTVLIKFLIDAGLLEIKDPENFIPIMDYHMQRVLMRMGCVEVIDKELKYKLWNKEKIKSDEDIRNACVEATKRIAKISGYGVVKMNDFFYPLGRSCCQEKTLCFDKECNKNPCTFNLVIDLPSHEKCVFEGACKGSLDENYRKYWQPFVDTHFY